MKLLILAFITHFIADFLLQSREMGKNKSSNYKFLSQHIGIIFVCFLPFGLKFAAANALIHAIIDKNIWNLYKLYVVSLYESERDAAYHEYWEDHWFYATIGFDQLLHALTLIVLFNYL